MVKKLKGFKALLEFIDKCRVEDAQDLLDVSTML